jgi:hypothetical protein
LDAQSVITHTSTVAGGRYAPGHLGELTQHLPFEMADEALAATRTTQTRLRDLPSRVVIYLLLAACLFPETGYPGVWRKLTSGLTGLPQPTPTASALAQARHRLGAAPLHWLFDLLRWPAAAHHQTGSWWRGLLVCAIDGTTLTVSDTPRNLSRFTKQRGNHGGTGYPQIRLLVLLACGTRSVIDAVFGPTTRGETTYTPHLFRSLHTGMILLADRNFGAVKLLTQIAATGADLLVRLKNGRVMPIVARYSDGSYLSILGGRPAGTRHRMRDHHHHHRRTPNRHLPAGHHPARPTRLPRRRIDPALPRTMGDRDRLPGTEILHPGRPSTAGPHPGRGRAGGLRAAGDLSTAAHRYRRRGQRPTWHRSGPGQFHHRLASRP